MTTCHEPERTSILAATTRPPCLLDDPDWLNSRYVHDRLGTGTIARAAGTTAWAVRRKLDDHGIAMRTQRVSSHPRFDADWLASRYLDRDRYRDWCVSRGVPMQTDGGHRLSTGAIAKIIGDVSRESVRRWLHHHGIPVRGGNSGLAGSASAARLFEMGRGARAALRQFEDHPLVEGVQVDDDAVRLSFSTGMSESWARRHNEGVWKVFPGRGWWGEEPLAVPQYNSHRLLDAEYDALADPFFEYAATAIGKAGFFDQRILIHSLAKRLSEEGWNRLEFPASALVQDLADLRSDRTRYSVTRGYLRGQPGRPRSGPPPGMLLCNAVRDWGGLPVRGRLSLADAWANPRGLAFAIDQIVRKGQALNRAAIIHRMTTGSSYGVPAKAGPRWMSPNLYTAVWRDILGINTRPVVLDPTPGCGARAVATAMMNGFYIHPAGMEFSSRGPLWQDGAELVVDDGDVTADVGFIECADAAEFEAAVEDYGRRCCFVVAVLPWDQREGVLALPGARVVRYKPRPFLDDSIVAVWEQA